MDTEPALVLVAACAIGVGSFVISFLGGLLALKIVALVLEAPAVLENLETIPWARCLDYALTQIVTEVLPLVIHRVERVLPAILNPSDDGDWPVVLQFPFYGLIMVPLVVAGMFAVMGLVRVVRDAVEQRNEAEARRMQAEAEQAAEQAEAEKQRLLVGQPGGKSK